MQQPPPYQQPPYQPPPPGGFGAPGVPPTMAQQPPGDRLRMPMQLLIAACGLAIVRVLAFTVISQMVQSSGNYSLYRITSPVQALLGVVGGGLMVGAAASLVSQKRPGHPLALGAAIAAGLGILFSVMSMFVGAFGVSYVVSLLHALVGAAALIGLALALREIGRSRERPVDELAFAVVGIAVTAMLVSIIGRLGLPLGEASRYVSLLLALGEYGALIAIAVRIMSYVPASEMAMGDPSAYRGPQGAYPMDAVAPQGSIALGFLAGFFGGCIGLGLVLALAKGPATKRGAGIGFACQTIVGIGLRAAAH